MQRKGAHFAKMNGKKDQYKKKVVSLEMEDLPIHDPLEPDQEITKKKGKGLFFQEINKQKR